MVYRARVLLLTLTAFAAGIPAAIGGPTSPYYLTDGEAGVNWVVQGNSVVNSWAQQHHDGFGEYPIAVGTTVRILGNGSQSIGRGGTPELGSEYTLDGTYTGVDYPYPAIDASFWDGASDGTYFYSVDLDHRGVYRFDNNWSNPVLLFVAPFGPLGITYDLTSESLWIAGWSSPIVANFALDGTQLTSFVTPFDELTCLALDPADDTLWLGTWLGNTFYQYSKTGVLLGSETYDGISNTLGGEFAVPEPQTLLVAGLGLLALACKVQFRQNTGH